MKTILRLAFLVAAAIFAREAAAFCIPSPSSDNAAFVHEYYDAPSGRYYSSWSAPADLGGCYPPQVTLPAPQGTTTTALAWSSWAFAGGCETSWFPSPLCSFSRKVCAFRAQGQGDPASVFLSIDPEECGVLASAGWTPLTDAPALAAFRLDPATGQCPASTVPLRRFVNARWGEGLGNHRYVADEQVVREMRSKAGWTEERIAFCVPEAYHTVVSGDALSFDFCQNGECLAAIHMAPGFGTTVGPVAPSESAVFTALTGAHDPAGSSGFATNGSHVTGYAASPVTAMASRSFAQVFHGGAGFQVRSADSAGGPASIVAAARRSVLIPLAPFLTTYEVGMEFTMSYRVFVKRVRAAAGPGSEAYVQPLVTFTDSRSGLALVLSPGAIGTPLMADGVARDAASGNVLVFVNLGEGTSIGTSEGLPSLRTPKTFDSADGNGWGGDFRYRLNSSDFRFVISRARVLEPGLSEDPADYLVTSFGMKGEAAGDAEVDYNVERLDVAVIRP
jgi:hypothetical protein